MKIVISDGNGPNLGDLSWDGMSSCGEVHIYDRNEPDEILARAEGADILIVNDVSITSKIEGTPAIGPLAMLVRWLSGEIRYEDGWGCKTPAQGGRRPTGAGVLGKVDLRERLVADPAVRPLAVVLLAPVADDYLGLEQPAEDFAVEAAVAEPAVEALAPGVLPWAAGIDVDRPDAGLPQPSLDLLGDELGAVVAAQGAWSTVL